MRRTERYVWPTIAAIVLATFLAGLSAGCSGNPPPDTSQLSPVGMADYQVTRKVNLIWDVNTGVIAANTSGVLPDDLTAQVLTVSKQLLDYLAANPQTNKERALLAFKEAREALPTVVDGRIAVFLLQLSDILTEVQS